MMEHSPLEGIEFLCGDLIDDRQALDVSGSSHPDAKYLHASAFGSTFFAMKSIFKVRRSAAGPRCMSHLISCSCLIMMVLSALTVAPSFFQRI